LYKDTRSTELLSGYFSNQFARGSYIDAATYFKHYIWVLKNEGWIFYETVINK